MRARRPYADAMLNDQEAPRPLPLGRRCAHRAVLLGSGALAGCSVSRDDDEPSKARGHAEPRADADRDRGANDRRHPRPPRRRSPRRPRASPSASPAATPEAALLTAAEMPQLNSSSPGQVGRTGPAGTRPFGLCQKFDLLTIGAIEAVERTFTHEGDTAGQQVAEFADAQTRGPGEQGPGGLAPQLCRAGPRPERAGAPDHRRRRSPRGRAGTTSSASSGAARATSTPSGWCSPGTRMTLLRMDHDGQDHNYPPGKDPMELAVKACISQNGLMRSPR